MKENRPEFYSVCLQYCWDVNILKKQLSNDINKKQYIVQNSYKKMGKWKSQSEGEVVQIKFPKPTKAKSHFEKWGGWKHGSCKGRLLHKEKVA